MNSNFKDALIKRRSFYGISKDKIVDDSVIIEIVNEAIKYTPSAFNSQSSRIVLLLNKEHDNLWDLTKESLRKIVPLDKFKATEDRINSFKNGYGTVLFFEDELVIHSLEESYKLYKDNFSIWSQQTSGMHQFVVWSALELEGFGASLQHYSELIEEEVKDKWNIPKEWKLIAQMPFGKPTFLPEEKTFKPIEDRVKVFK